MLSAVISGFFQFMSAAFKGIQGGNSTVPAPLDYFDGTCRQ